MRIFISQSGERSEALARAIEHFVRLVLPNTVPWVSTTGIDKGSRWNQEVSKSLDEAQAGIICLTPENLAEPWVLFEAGALSRKPADKVWTVLLGVAHAQVELPLGQFQHTLAERADFYKVVASINRSTTQPRRDEDLETLFDRLWPTTLGPTIEDLLRKTPVAAPPIRPVQDMVTEMLEAMRELRRDAVVAHESQMELQSYIRHSNARRPKRQAPYPFNDYERGIVMQLEQLDELIADELSRSTQSERLGDLRREREIASNLLADAQHGHRNMSRLSVMEKDPRHKADAKDPSSDG